MWVSSGPRAPLPAHCPSPALTLALTQICAVVLELLWELLQVGLSERNDLPTTGLLQHGSVPVIGTDGSQQNSILALGRGHTSALAPQVPLSGKPHWVLHHEAYASHPGHLVLDSYLIAQLVAGIFGF